MVEAEGAAVHVNTDPTSSKRCITYAHTIIIMDMDGYVESQEETTSRDSVSYKTLKTLLQTALT